MYHADFPFLSALLLEEHALQLLSEKDSRFESQQSRRTVSPWLILSDVEQRQPAESQVALSRRDKWLARRICRLLGGGAPRRQDGEQNHKGRRKLGKRRDGGRSRKRRRKEVVRVASDGVMQEKEGGCEYYSSENYSNTSDEDGEKGQVDVALSNSRE